MNYTDTCVLSDVDLRIAVHSGWHPSHLDVFDPTTKQSRIVLFRHNRDCTLSTVLTLTDDKQVNWHRAVSQLFTVRYIVPETVESHICHSPSRYHILRIFIKNFLSIIVCSSFFNSPSWQASNLSHFSLVVCTTTSKYSYPFGYFLCFVCFVLCIYICTCLYFHFILDIILHIFIVFYCTIVRLSLSSLKGTWLDLTWLVRSFLRSKDTDMDA